MKPIDDKAAERLLDLAAVHGMAEVLDFLADNCRMLPECFERPLPASVALAEKLDALAVDAKAADAELEPPAALALVNLGEG